MVEHKEHQIKALKKLLTIVFCLFGFPFIIMYYNVMNERPLSEEYAMPVLILWSQFYIMFYIILGILAKRNNLNVIKWVGLSILFPPVSTVISYFMILKHKSAQT